MAGAVRIELTTYGFGDRCSTNWAIPLYMGRLVGIEPTNAGATIQCVNRFTTTAIISNRQFPILPARLQTSTFGLWMLNCCVRNGNRWNHPGNITGYYFVEICYLKTKQKKFMNQTFHDSSGQRQPINFALRAHFLGRFRIRLVTQSLTLLDKSVIR